MSSKSSIFVVSLSILLSACGGSAATDEVSVAPAVEQNATIVTNVNATHNVYPKPIVGYQAAE